MRDHTGGRSDPPPIRSSWRASIRSVPRTSPKRDAVAASPIGSTSPCSLAISAIPVSLWSRARLRLSSTLTCWPTSFGVHGTPSPITPRTRRPCASIGRRSRRSSACAPSRDAGLGIEAAAATDGAEAIVSAMVQQLRASRVGLPAASTLERIALIARAPSASSRLHRLGTRSRPRADCEAGPAARGGWIRRSHRPGLTSGLAGAALRRQPQAMIKRVEHVRAGRAERPCTKRPRQLVGRDRPRGGDQGRAARFPFGATGANLVRPDPCPLSLDGGVAHPRRELRFGAGRRRLPSRPTSRWRRLRRHASLDGQFYWAGGKDKARADHHETGDLSHSKAPRAPAACRRIARSTATMPLRDRTLPTGAKRDCVAIQTPLDEVSSTSTPPSSLLASQSCVSICSNRSLHG